jgi:hypothetical protein
MPALGELIDSLPLECRPHAIRGDCNYFNEANLVECEKRGIPYLFKLRQTAKVKNLIHLLEQEGGWVDCGQGFEVIEGEVHLGGWSCKRRMIVARRLVKQDATEDDKKALPLWFLFIGNAEMRKILLTNSKATSKSAPSSNVSPNASSTMDASAPLPTGLATASPASGACVAKPAKSPASYTNSKPSSSV